MFVLLAIVLTACSGSKSPDGAATPPTTPAPTPAPSASVTEPADKALKLVPRQIALAHGRKTFTLNVPEEFDIQVALEGLKRVRFMAESPDHRIFVTDMINLSDNRKGSVYAVGQLNKQTGKLGEPIEYLTGLRNPNSIAFHTEPSGAKWLFLALTDKLVRYPYKDGDTAPSGPPQTLANYPDVGLGFGAGGWHLTRTVVVGPNNKLYVAVGSSCNVCEERQEIRATISEMDLDGSNSRIIARGLRNAVGLKFADGQLYATNMGADHLGDDEPEETLYRIKVGADYGWPYCYQFQGKIRTDTKLGALSPGKDCSVIPLAFATFKGHSSPLGLEYFDPGYFLVALHGSSNKALKRGYQISRVKEGSPPEDFITGFQEISTVYGRPVDIMKVGGDGFLVSDDGAGVIYYVHKKAGP